MSENVEIRSGWIFRQKTLLQKRWKKKWMVLFQDGRLCFKSHNFSKSHGRLWNMKSHCLHIWGEKHCHHLLPPPESTSTCLMELLFVGNKRLTLCALTVLEAQKWRETLEKARVIRTSINYHSSVVPFVVEDDDDDSEHLCCFSWRAHNKVREINYRPATQRCKRKKTHKRHVSWNDQITTIA